MTLRSHLKERLRIKPKRIPPKVQRLTLDRSMGDRLKGPYEAQLTERRGQTFSDHLVSQEYAATTSFPYMDPNIDHVCWQCGHVGHSGDNHGTWSHKGKSDVQMNLEETLGETLDDSAFD